jgi:hypothetical protein
MALFQSEKLKPKSAVSALSPCSMIPALEATTVQDYCSSLE